MNISVNKNKLTRDVKREANKIFAIAAKEATEKSKQLLSKTYDLIIDQYYEYRTTSYYRHETGIGTGTGLNLYRSNNKINTYTDRLRLEIDARDMDGYHRMNKEKVLDMILNGIRGVPNHKGSSLNGRFMFQNMNFQANIPDRFGNIEGTPRQVMTEMCRRITTSYYPMYWNESFRKETKTGKYEYFSEEG